MARAVVVSEPDPFCKLIVPTGCAPCIRVTVPVPVVEVTETLKVTASPIIEEPEAVLRVVVLGALLTTIDPVAGRPTRPASVPLVVA